MAVSNLPKICDDALGYASLGIRVFPCFGINDDLTCRCGEEGCASPGKHPKTHNGLHSASLEPTYIRFAWESDKWGNNLAGVTGETFWVLDVDKKHGGLETLAEWEAEFGELDAAWIQKTGGGGRQYFFKHTAGITNTSGKLGDGIDTRGEGGYVMLPPSKHVSGEQYRWHKDKRPHVKELFEAPEWLLAKVFDYLGDRPAKRLDHNEVFEGIAEGSRNDAIFRLAASLRAQGVDYDIALSQCLYAASRCKPPFPERETRTVVEGVYHRYEAGPARVVIETRDDGEIKDFPLTDLGNAERLIWRLDGNVRFCHLFQKWLIWNGVRWQWDETGGAVLLQEAARMVREMDDDGWARKCEARSKLSNMLELAKLLRGVSVTPDELDRNQRLLGVANGTLNLSTGQLQEPNKDDLITMSSPVEFVEGAECPTFEGFVEDVCLNDHNLVAYIQAAMGYTLTGLTNEECLFFCYGEGSNGKSTLLDLIDYLMGDYAKSIPSDLFSSSTSIVQAESLIATLKGARFVQCSEASNKRIAENFVKQFVDDASKLNARHKYGHPFEFKPVAKTWMAGNTKPQITGQDWGIWRRYKLLPFLLHVPNEKQDKKLKEKLKREASGILNWALDGLSYYIENNGLPECPAVDAFTEEHRHDMDTLGNFIVDCCETSPNYEIRSSVLYEAYSKWCKWAGHGAYSQTKFSLEVKKRGLIWKRTAKGNVFQGIDLNDEAIDGGAAWQKR